MSADREQEKLELADLIISGVVKSDFRPDLSKLDAADVVLGLAYNDTYEAMVARERCTEALLAQAAAWIEADPRGSLMLDERVERAEEDDQEMAERHEPTGEAA